MSRYIPILLLFFSSFTQAQNLRIGLFNDLTTKMVVFTTVNGSYLMTADNRAIQNIKANQNFLLQKEGDSVRCMAANSDLGLYKTIILSAMSDSSVFSLRPVNPKSEIRYYNDNLELNVNLGKMHTINVVDIDKYLAGVVEAEGGSRATLEYYKTQATLCRTYALSHLDKHIAEGFFLCDGVHCQAYHGKCLGKTSIIKGAFDTRGQVIVDTDSMLITAAFYSNCGGETESAQNVWLLKKNYLKPIQDPYCQNQKNSLWERKIPVEQWKTYLVNNGFSLNSDLVPSYYNYTQFARKQYYKLGKDSLTFRKIRNDFKLKSAFFSIEVKGNNVEIHGRGYGHGVGLCQEGAMQMAVLGYNYQEIVQFYYQGVRITDYRSIPFTKNPSIGMITGK
jgi:stage II sporulation protein D